jgi:hypothetical protein
MAKIRKMGEDSLREAETGVKEVKRNREEAERLVDLMKAYMLLSRYYEKKVAAGVQASVYFYSGKPEDRKEALQLAGIAVNSYMQAAEFMHEKLDPVMTRLYGRPLREGGSKLLPELIADEKKEREELPKLFHWRQ